MRVGEGGRIMEGLSIAFYIIQICFDLFVIGYIVKNWKKDE